MLGPIDLLLAGILPGLVALAIRQATLRASGKDALAWSIAISVAFVVGQVATAASTASGASGWFADLPRSAALFTTPREASQWLPAAVVVAGAVALLSGGARAARWGTLVLGTLLAYAVPTRLLWGSVYFLSRWSQTEAIAWVAALGSALLLVGWLLTSREAVDHETAVYQPKGWMRAGLLPLVTLGLAIVMATSGSLSYALLAGVLTASLTGAALGGFGLKKPSTALDGIGSAGPVVATLAGSILMLGYFYAEVTELNAALLAAAIAVAGAARTQANRPTATWRGAALRATLCVGLLGAATVNAGLAFAEATAEKEANPYAGWSAE